MHRTACTVLDLADHAADLGGGQAGPFGQLAHFVGDDREATALFAGAGGFDCGVEGEEVGLVGDFLDRVDDRGDLVGLTAQVFDDGRGGLDSFRNFAHLVGGVVNHVGAFLRDIAGFERDAVGFAGVFLDLIDADGHFLNGSGHR